jgi:uncharacterized protein involved in type VI secretion and phage assembly
MHDESTQRLLEHHLSKFFGKYRGLVTDNRDDLQRGRLKVQVPQVLGDAEVWALPCVPYAGKDVGFFAMPKTGTVVWVEFEAGDASYPIWTGALWALGDIDPADAGPDVKFFKTDKFTLRIDDSAGEITIENQGGTQIVLSSSDLKMKSGSVSAETTGGKKTELTDSSFSVNDGNLEVL